MKKIGIIGAMPSELKDLRKMFGEAEIVRKSGFDFHINTVGERQIINACCGISKVNAAVCCQAMIDNFQIDAVINAGIAGGMNDDVKVCDIVISSDVLPHDLDIHFLENYPPYCGAFRADANLIDMARKVCDEQGYKSFVGRIVSGEAFISDIKIKLDIVRRLSPYAVDMETSAIGHCCYLNETPFVSVRCISDNADDEGEISFSEFEKIAARRVAEIVYKMVIS